MIFRFSVPKMPTVRRPKLTTPDQFRHDLQQRRRERETREWVFSLMPTPAQPLDNPFIETTPGEL